MITLSTESQAAAGATATVMCFCSSTAAAAVLHVSCYLLFFSASAAVTSITQMLAASNVINATQRRLSPIHQHKSFIFVQLTRQQTQFQSQDSHGDYFKRTETIRYEQVENILFLPVIKSLMSNMKWLLVVAVQQLQKN